MDGVAVLLSLAALEIVFVVVVSSRSFFTNFLQYSCEFFAIFQYRVDDADGKLIIIIDLLNFEDNKLLKIKLNLVPLIITQL